MPNVVKFPLVNVEDKLLDISALAKFVLFMLENTERHELLDRYGELVTMMYLITEKAQAGRDGIEDMARRKLQRKLKEA